MNNRVTIEDVQNAITKTDYVVLPDGRTTICQLTLDNNFTIRGESSCVDPANFDKTVGQDIAKANAMDKVWQFLGFRLADRLHKISGQVGEQKEINWLDRLHLEFNELSIKMDKLRNFFDSEAFAGLDLQDQNLLRAQLAAMSEYWDVLDKRLSRHMPAVQQLSEPPAHPEAETNPDVIVPTNGRQVWYTEVVDGVTKAEDLAATVVHVWHNRMVNLQVLDPNANPHARHSVPLIQPGEPIPQGQSYCRWMPYQIAQKK